jgi:hypothetical protein
MNSDITRSADDPDDIETVCVGFFRYKERKGAPWQPLRIMRESGAWVVLLAGNVVAGSGAAKARDVPFLLWRSPFHAITEQAYDALLREYQNAPPGSPLQNPSEPVDLRAAPPLYEGRVR